MAYSYPELKRFMGLFLQSNSFTVPDGALEVAENIVISKDGIITKKPGNYLYFTPSSGTLNKLYTYQNKLIAIYNNKISYFTDTGASPNETGSETALGGETVASSAPAVARALQSNANFYFTTDNGPYKLSSYSSAVAKSGAPPGLDISARFNASSSSAWLRAGYIVGYRVIFGYRDSNDNLILGAPSDITTITNSEVSLSGASVATAAGTTVTVTSPAHGLTSGQWLQVYDVLGFTTPANAVGTFQITVTGANTFTYVTGVAPGGGPATALKYAYAMPIDLEFSVPSEVTSAQSWFYQVYRSSQQQASVGIFSDFKLLEEFSLSASELSSRVVFFTDDYDDILLGAELYTNENSREGELAANHKPPKCLDLALFKNYAIYANCTSRQLLSLALIDTTVIAAGDFVELKTDATTRRYVAAAGVGNLTTQAQMSNAAGDLLLTVTAHGFSNGWQVYVGQVSGGSLVAGSYYVVSSAANTFKISATPGGPAITFGGETSSSVQAVTNGTYPVFYLSQSVSAAVRLQETAQALVKAINRDQSATVYAQYASTPSQVPGKMVFQAKGFGGAIYARANTSAVGAAFSPVLPQSFASGNQVFSRGDSLPHVLYVSKLNEPEAVPLVNFLTVGAKNKAIVRIHALRDSLIILKEDGVFRMTGDSPTNFTVTLLDSTVQIVAPSSSDVLNNQVAFLSNQGVCLVTESAVQIISRTIEDVIQPILGQANLAAETSAVAYESARSFLLTTTSPNSNVATQTYVYNLLTDQWTSWTDIYRQAVVGPGDTLYAIDAANNILKERKKQTRLDFCGQNFSATISTVSLDGKSSRLTLPLGTLASEGDIVVKNDVINTIASASFVSSGVYDVSFERVTNLSNGDTVTFYKGYRSTIKLAPFHAGLVGRMKVFTQMQLHAKDFGASKLKLQFGGDTVGGSEEVTWQAIIDSLGWGFFPWGFAAFGQAAATSLTVGTQPAPIVRVYVPKFAARTTFIQPIIVHDNAAEPLNFQSLSFAVRAYGERVSR